MQNDLINIINKRAQAAGFKSPDGGKLVLLDNENWPEVTLENQLFYWYSDFASILIVDVSCNTFAEALQFARRAETYLDAALVHREKNGSVIDGYLVLAMTQMNDDLKPFIVEIEKDTRFVRKHVVFQGEQGWERYQRITPLGIVDSFDEVKITEFVPDSEKSSQLLASLSKLGSTQLARLHGKEWNLNE
jgi:hypothetical protein